MMLYHIALRPMDFAGRRKLKLLIVQGTIILAGNSNLKIYGLLKCSSGKRMKIENRVFFSSEQEAINEGYRPCGNCMKYEYKKWKNGFV